jgi:hypothetical protein
VKLSHHLWKKMLKDIYRLHGTYDATMVEALRYLYMENKELKNELEGLRIWSRWQRKVEKVSCPVH